MKGKIIITAVCIIITVLFVLHAARRDTPASIFTSTVPAGESINNVNNW